MNFNNNVIIDKNYVYYFFIAKYIANNIDDEEIKQIVDKLSKRLFREQYASIIMFVTHLSKNKWIIGSLLNNAEEIFKEECIMKLEDDISSVNNLITKLPTDVIKQINIEKERDIKIEEQEKIEQMEREFDDEVINYSHFSLEDDVSSIDVLAKANLAFKTIDLLGQVAKKYWGELDAKIKYNIVYTTYSLGLRSLSLYFKLINESHKDIAEYISSRIVEKYIKNSTKEWNVSLNKDLVKKISTNLIITLCYLSSWGVIKRIANSIGYDQLNLTFKNVLNDNQYNSYKLIDLAIELSQKGIPIDEIKEYSSSMKDNNMCLKLLRDLAIDHLYMFDVTYERKSQLESYLGIKIHQQQFIQGSSKIKK